MSKRDKKLTATIVSPATEIEIEIRILIREVHARTGTICDKRARTISFAMGDDFEKAADWLKSDDAYMQFGDLCVEARSIFGLDSGGTR